MSNAKFSFTATVLVLFNVHVESFSSTLPTELVPINYQVIESVRGDLNKDGQEDIVLLVKATDKTRVVANERGQSVDRNRRGIIIAFKKGDKYELILKNTNCFSSNNEDGGVYFQPELSLNIKKGSLIVEYAHGRYGYWSYTFRFQKGDFELVGYDISNNRGPVVESATSINFISKKVLSRVNVNQTAEGGDERFKKTWSTVKISKPIKLSEIVDFDELSVEKEIGLKK